MTDISVQTQILNPENLSWDLSNPEVPHIDGGTLDVSTFTQGVHFVNGYLPSGTVLGKVTATGYAGPYLAAATDGRQTAVGITRQSVQLVMPNGLTRSKVGVAIMTAWGVVSGGSIPPGATIITVNSPTSVTLSAAAGSTASGVPVTIARGGYLDSGAITALSHLHFVG